MLLCPSPSGWIASRMSCPVKRAKKTQLNALSQAGWSQADVSLLGNDSLFFSPLWRGFSKSATTCMFVSFTCWLGKCGLASEGNSLMACALYLSSSRGSERKRLAHEKLHLMWEVGGMAWRASRQNTMSKGDSGYGEEAEWKLSLERRAQGVRETELGGTWDLSGL